MSSDSLPSHPDWRRHRLGEVADITLGGTPSTDVRGYWGGTIPWMSSGEVNKKRVFEADGRITEAGLAASNATLIDPPTVAVGLAGQGKTRGTAALVNIRVCTNQSIALIKGREGQLDTFYLFHNLDGRYDELRTRSAGGGRAGLSRGILAAVPIGLPDLAEQTRIALVLDTVDEAIAKTEAVIAKLRQVRAGLLHDLLTRGLSPVASAKGDLSWTLRDPIAHPEQFQPSPLGQIPKEWDVRAIDRVCTEIVDCKNRTPPYTSTGYPVVRTSNVRDGELIKEDLLFTDAAGYREWTQRRVPQAGDLIITREAPVGQACLVPPEMPLCLGQRMMLYVFDPDEASSRFYLYFILSNTMQRRFEAISDGSTVKHVRLEDMRSFTVPFPRVDEQQSIARVIFSQDAAIKSVESECAKLHRLKSGLMTDLLTGRVRVPEVLNTRDSKP